MQVDQVGCVFGGMPGHALLCHLRSSVARVQPAAHPSRSGRQRDVRTAKGRLLYEAGTMGEGGDKNTPVRFDEADVYRVCSVFELELQETRGTPALNLLVFCRLNDNVCPTLRPSSRFMLV